MKKFAMVVAVLAVAAWAGSANAAVGISLQHNGSYVPAVGLNFQPTGWVIDVLGAFQSVDQTYTQFGALVNADKLFDETADVSGLWGLTADVLMTSPEVGDSWTDFGFGAYIGGNAHLGSENFHLVGHCGVRVDIFGARSDLDESATDFGTFANLMLRWTGALSK